MLRNKLFPYAVYMAKAGEEQGGGAAEEEVDRGDDFDPALFEEQEDAARGSTKKEKDEEESEEDESDAAEETDESDPAKVEAKDKKEPKKDEKTPTKDKPSRAEKRVQQLLERNAALERQLVTKTGSEEAATTLADLETRSAQLEKDYHKALAEDPDKAIALMRAIREIDRKIARVEATVEAEATVHEKLESRDLQTTINELTTAHPELDKGSDEYDQELVSEINSVFSGLVTTGVGKAAAMRRAVKYVMGSTESAGAALGDTTPGDKVRKDRKVEGSRKTADALNRQPASVANAGKTSPSTGITKIRTIKDLDKLTEAELSKERGDTF